MKPQDFLAMLVPAAQACQRATGIPASFTLGQAALESAWGEKALGNNLFGVKADGSWRGPVVNYATHEHIGAQDVAIHDNFRAYPNWQASMDDHAKFFRDNHRYADCFLETSGHGWARAVERAHYATGLNYADRLIAVMDGRRMSQYDTLPEGK